MQHVLLAAAAIVALITVEILVLGRIDPPDETAAVSTTDDAPFDVRAERSFFVPLEVKP